MALDHYFVSAPAHVHPERAAAKSHREPTDQENARRKPPHRNIAENGHFRSGGPERNGMNLPDDGPKVVGFLVGLESRIGTIDPLLRPRTVGGPSRPRPGSFLGFVDTVRAMTLRVALQG